MNSGRKTTTLNDHHIGMIRGYISNNIHVIKSCLTKLGKSIEQIAQYLNHTINTPIGKDDEKKYLANEVANKTGLYKDLPLRCMQLSAIFNPNYAILNNIGVINHTHDKEYKVTPDDFDQVAGEIHDFSILTLDKFIRGREKDLLPYKKNFDILSELISENVDAELEIFLHSKKP
jgi:hypothetical protein